MVPYTQILDAAYVLKFWNFCCLRKQHCRNT